jgi:hypothetical protein
VDKFRDPKSPLDQLIDGREAQRLPLCGDPQLTLRDEANTITAWILRDALKELAAEPAPGGVPRISNAEQRRVLVEVSARLAHWLAGRERLMSMGAGAYQQFVSLGMMVTDGWERQAITVPGGADIGTCSSCRSTINDAWRYCPACGTPVHG